MLNGYNNQHSTLKFRRRSEVGPEYANAIYRVERRKDWLPLYPILAIIFVAVVISLYN